MFNSDQATKAVESWLNSYRNEKTRIAARNVVAAGIVVLDKLLNNSVLSEEEAFTERGELKGARSGLRSILERHGIPCLYLKEATGRQAATYARALLERLQYGKQLPTKPETRQKILLAAVEILRNEAFAWLHRGPVRVIFDRQSAPELWIRAILKKAEGRSGGKIEQHLVGAKLQERYGPAIKISEHPGHAGDVQTKRSGDFDLGQISYHVTATPTRDHLRKCKDNAIANRVPVLLVPAEKMDRALVYAKEEGIESRITIVSLESFVGQNVMELSIQLNVGVLDALKSILQEYNRRVNDIENDSSLMIDIE